MSGHEVHPDALVVPDRSLTAVVGRRVTGHAPVDVWGLDVDLAAVLRSLPGLGAAVRVEGAGRLPDGPALLVHRRGPLPGGRLALAVGISVAVDRPVRLPGVPDVAPVIGALRRVGGVSGHPADLRGLLLAGELVAVGVPRAFGRDRGVSAGDGDGEVVGPGAAPAALAAAMAVGAPLVPVGVAPAAPLRRARVRVGEPVPTRRRRRARAADDVAEEVRGRLDELTGAVPAHDG